MFEIETFFTIKLYTYPKMNCLLWNYFHKSGFSVNNLQTLTCHETQTTNQPTNHFSSSLVVNEHTHKHTHTHIYMCVCVCVCVCACVYVCVREIESKLLPCQLLYQLCNEHIDGMKEKLTIPIKLLSCPVFHFLRSSSVKLFFVAVDGTVRVSCEKRQLELEKRRQTRGKDINTSTLYGQWMQSRRSAISDEQ